ncbi:MAG: DUF6314 family protein [Rhodobacterales bacterium]
MLDLMDFAGQWRVERQIRDANGPDAVFGGTATFTPDDAGLRLQESGELRLIGQGAFQAQRAYLWRQCGSLIAVMFDDGRDFHLFDPAHRIAHADHWCDPDTYKVRYDFSGWPRWQAQWQVNGPRKAYSMQSVYSPLQVSGLSDNP